MEKEKVKEVVEEKKKNPKKTWKQILNEKNIDRSYQNFAHYRKKYGLFEKDYRKYNKPSKKEKSNKEKNQKEKNQKEKKEKGLLEKSLLDIKGKAKEDREKKQKKSNKAAKQKQNKKADKKNKIDIIKFFTDYKYYIYAGAGVITLIAVYKLIGNKKPKEKEEPKEKKEVDPLDQIKTFKY